MDEESGKSGKSGKGEGGGKPRDRASRAYVKPEVKRVRLDSEVLLVKGCKMATGAARNSAGCRGPIFCKGHTPGS